MGFYNDNVKNDSCKRRTLDNTSKGLRVLSKVITHPCTKNTFVFLEKECARFG